MRRSDFVVGLGLAFFLVFVLVVFVLEVVVELFVGFFLFVVCGSSRLLLEFDVNSDVAKLGVDELEELIDVVARPLFEHVGEELVKIAVVETALDFLHLFFGESFENIFAQRLGIAFFDGVLSRESDLPHCALVENDFHRRCAPKKRSAREVSTAGGPARSAHYSTHKSCQASNFRRSTHRGDDFCECQHFTSRHRRVAPRRKRAILRHDFRTSASAAPRLLPFAQISAPARRLLCSLPPVTRASVFQRLRRAACAASALYVFGFPTTAAADAPVPAANVPPEFSEKPESGPNAKGGAPLVPRQSRGYTLGGVGFATEVILSPGALCRRTDEPCVFGSGAGIFATGGYRFPSGWSVGGTYEMTKHESNKIYRLAMLQQLQFNLRYLAPSGRAVAPWAGCGVAAIGYGESWGFDTGGGSTFLEGGAEIQLSRSSSLRLGAAYRGLVFGGYVDSATQKRPAAFAQTFGLIVALESHDF